MEWFGGSWKVSGCATFTPFVLLLCSLMTFSSGSRRVGCIPEEFKHPSFDPQDFRM
jgi:hypothetical protein